MCWTEPRSFEVAQREEVRMEGAKRPDQFETDLPQNMGIECLSKPHPAVRDLQAVVKFQGGKGSVRTLGQNGF